MKNKKIFFLLIILLFSCNNNKKHTQEIDANKNLQIIDVSKAHQADKIFLSELCSRVKTIILETNENVLLGKINGMQVYKDWIFILDKQNAGVYLFNKDGKFIRKYGQRGIGPGEYLTVSDFTIDTDNDAIYLMDSDANQIIKYKILTGEFENTIKLEDKNVQRFHIQYNNNKLYADINYIIETETGCMIQEIDLSTGKQNHCWLDPHKYNNGWNGPIQRENESFFYSRNQGTFKYIHFFMDTIISFSDNRIAPVYVLKDKDWITSKEVGKIKEERITNQGATSFRQLFNKNVAFNINSYVEWGDFILFCYQKKHDSFFVLHNIQTGDTRITSLLIDDLVCKKPFLVNRFSCSDSNGLYNIMNANDLIRLIEQSGEEDFLNPDLDKITILKNLPADSNPVIFYYEF
ncbi:hypothetical protein AGMMS50239_24910 [Bacteroidia bacterium]|nr:hypothetical protein AGMMS50239_24910 [Bacteroidia bacterium]